MVATRPLRQPTASRNAGAARVLGSRRRSTLALIQGSLSSDRAARSNPLLAGFHRAADGTLAGLGICMLALSGLTLHWQNQWGHSYQQLEASQILEHRLQEAAALLEQHYLGATGKPGWLVPASSEKLIYLNAAPAAPHSGGNNLFSNLQPRQVPAGY